MVDQKINVVDQSAMNSVPHNLCCYRLLHAIKYAYCQ